MVRYLVFMIALLAQTVAFAQDPIEGLWYNEEETAKIKIYRAKNDKFYGKIDWLKEPVKDGKERTDEKNPDKDKRNERLLGLVVLKGFEKYNPHANAATISKIGYYFYADYEERMEIQSDGQCYLSYPGYDTMFTARLETKQLAELWNFTSYLDVPSGKYKECGTFRGFSRGAFIIHFTDGTKRELVFGTKTPPMGLGYLGLKLSEISYRLDWQPAEKCSGPDIPCPKLDTSKWKYTVDCSCRSIDEVVCYD